MELPDFFGSGVPTTACPLAAAPCPANPSLLRAGLSPTIDPVPATDRPTTSRSGSPPASRSEGRRDRRETATPVPSLRAVGGVLPRPRRARDDPRRASELAAS